MFYRILLYYRVQKHRSMSTDVIVVCASSEYLCKAICKAGGDSFKASFDVESKRDPNYSLIAVEAEGRLTSKMVYFVQWRKNSNAMLLQQSIEKLISITIQRAAEDNYKSVAFPAIGCGRFGCSVSIVAEAMVQEAHRMLQKYSLSILFVIEEEKINIYQEFKKQIDRLQPSVISPSSSASKSPPMTPPRITLSRLSRSSSTSPPRLTSQEHLYQKLSCIVAPAMSPSHSPNRLSRSSSTSPMRSNLSGPPNEWPRYPPKTVQTYRRRSRSSSTSPVRFRLQDQSRRESRPLSRRQSRSFSPSPPPPPVKPRKMITTNVNNGLIEAVKGDITTQRVDVIIGSSSSDILKKAIIKAAGDEVQTSYKNEYRNNPNSILISTPPGALPCKRIFFVKWKPDNDQTVLRQSLVDLVWTVIQNVISYNFTSFAFPALGCGQHGCSIDIVVETMVNETKNQLTRRNIPLTARFVIEPKQQNVYDEFIKRITETQNGIVNFFLSLLILNTTVYRLFESLTMIEVLKL
uniref:Macro BAL-like protein n=1 Tax=Adineta vaga TaxID=104782 RepID=B3G4K5_ADIVA|nr:macro BAL-like protein [Adineta vaga]